MGFEYVSLAATIFLVVKHFMKSSGLTSNSELKSFRAEKYFFECDLKNQCYKSNLGLHCLLCRYHFQFALDLNQSYNTQSYLSFHQRSSSGCTFRDRNVTQV